MNRAIGRVAMAVIVLMLLLVAQLTYLQVLDANTLAKDPRNTRTYLKDFTRPRGEIISADGKILARSIPSKDEYGYQREYPYGELFAQTVGYQSVVVGSTGVENYYSAVLSGRDRSHLRLGDLGDLLLGKQQTGNVVLSLRVDVQLIAKAALGTQAGSVVVTDPRTGAIIAMYSNPSFDPQPLAGHDPKAVQRVLEPAQPQQPDHDAAAARVPRALPTRVDVQDRDHGGRARHRHRDPDDDVPDAAFDHAAAGRQGDPELRRRELWRDPRGELRPLLQHDVRPARAAARRAVPAAPVRLRDLRGAADRPLARCRGEHRPGAGDVQQQQAVVRARRHRPG